MSLHMLDIYIDNEAKLQWPFKRLSCKKQTLWNISYRYTKDLHFPEMENWFLAVSFFLAHLKGDIGTFSPGQNLATYFDK